MYCSYCSPIPPASLVVYCIKLDNSLQNLEIPVVAYRKEGQYMEVDLSVQSDATAEYNLSAIKNFSSFNEYFIGEKLGLFGEDRTGTQIYIWNLDRWGTQCTLEWNSGKSSENPVHPGRGDILIRSRRVRSRPGQTSNKVCSVTLHQFTLISLRQETTILNMTSRDVF